MNRIETNDDPVESKVVVDKPLQRPTSVGSVSQKMIDTTDCEDNEKYHHSLVSWFALAYFIIYFLRFFSIFTYLPASLKLPLAGFMFCMGPGLALYTLLNFFRKSQFPYLTLFVLSCSLGLTFNFLTNVVVFLVEPSLPYLTEVYLATVGVIYGCILFYWKSSGVPLFTTFITVDRRTLGFIILGTVSIFYCLSVKVPAGLYVEELIVLRKLFENSQISPTNIAFWKGEYTTYFFVPFYLFLAMSAQFSGIDVLEIAEGMWPFTASISLLCLAAIVRHLAGQWLTVGVLVVMGLVHSLFLNQPMSSELTVFAPFPDRYALASGVLIPLVLVHFLIHMDHSRINIPAFVGLVYLIVEMTFIHARETLFFIGIVLIYSFIKAFDFKRNKRDLVRIFSLLCIVAAILFIYRYVNLGLQPSLDGYVSRMRDDMWMHFWRGLNSHGWLSLFGIPQFHTSQYWDSYQYATYFSHGRSFPGYGFVPLVICFLPLYVLAVERPSLLLAPAAIAALGLFSLFQGLHLLVGIAVGAPFIFEIFSVLFLLAAIVFADMTRMLGAIALLPPENKFSWIRKNLFRIVFVVLFFEFMVNIQPGYATGSLPLEILFYIVTLGCVAVRARMLRHTEQTEKSAQVPLSKGPSGGMKDLWSVFNMPGRVALVAGILAPKKKHAFLAFSIGIFMTGISFAFQQSDSQESEKIRYASRVEKAMDLGEIYNNLNRLHLFYHSRYHDWRLPASVIAYIRNEIPPLQTWFGGHTLPVLVVSNQYAPLLSFSGKISIGFSANIFFLDHLYGEGAAARRFEKEIHPQSDFTYYLSSGVDSDKLFQLLQGYNVEWILTRPEEKETIEYLIETRPEIRSALELVFEAEGFKIFRFNFSTGKREIQIAHN